MKNRDFLAVLSIKFFRFSRVNKKFCNVKKYLNYDVNIFVVNIINFAHGATLGWLSPFLPLLQSEDSPLETGPVTVEQGSWIGSILCLGGLAGAIIYGSLTNRLGVKRCISCIIIPNMVLHEDKYSHGKLDLLDSIFRAFG